MKHSAKTRNLKTTSDSVDSRFARVIEAFERDGRVSQTKMFGSVGLKVNGKVFALLQGKIRREAPRETR